ncbi:hypothetical protein CYMTET_12121 [Cymbomonas tetramitiformis]|uniref:Uncharacterized protein n=1 Tax=Cymbomonas tetramitiformis TaxID=36881 RepID=A0AAE0LCD5_9CHLO|nr:hypothetical protein CYMTET_12121 [Cymbomonas tetramitiformis]
MYFPYVGKLPEDFNAELVVAFETLKTGGVGEFVDGEQVFVWSVTERAYHTDGTAGSTEVVVEVVLENAVVAQEYSDTVYQEGEPFFWNSAYFSQFGEADIFEILLYSDRGDTLVETSAPGPGDDDSKEDMLTWILVGVVCGLVFLAGIEAYIVYRRRKDVGLVVDPADEEEDLKRGGRRVGIDIDKLAAATAEVDVPEVISALVSLLDSRPELAVRDKALQELATITEEKDAAMQRAAVVKAGAVPHLMSIIDSTASWVPNMSTTLRVPAKQVKGTTSAVLTMAHLARTKPFRDLARPLLPPAPGPLPTCSSLITSHPTPIPAVPSVYSGGAGERGRETVRSLLKASQLRQEGINLHIGGLLNSSLKREAWKDPQLQEMFRAVLQLVANITLANPVNQKALQMQGVPTRLVQLLLTLPRDHELRPSAIKAFNHVLNANQKYEEKEALVQAGCLAALIPSLESHTEAVTKLHTVEAINKVVAQHPELCREFLVHTRGLPLLVRLLDPKLSPKALLKHVVGTLMSMTRKEPRMRQAVCRGGAVEALLKLIDPKMDAVVVERASWTLNNLAVSNDAVQDAVREAGGIQTLIDMLERNTSSKSATKAALAALCHLAENPSNRDVVREANGVAVLVKHADYGASSRDVALMALQAVIKNNQMNLDELLELGGKRLLDEMEIMTPSLPNAPGLAAPPSPVAGAREAGGVFADELLAPDPEPQELLVRDEAGVKAPEEAIEDGAPSTAVFESPLMKPMDFLGDTVVSRPSQRL